MTLLVPNPGWTRGDLTLSHPTATKKALKLPCSSAKTINQDGLLQLLFLGELIVTGLWAGGLAPTQTTAGMGFWETFHPPACCFSVLRWRWLKSWSVHTAPLLQPCRPALKQSWVTTGKENSNLRGKMSASLRNHSRVLQSGPAWHRQSQEASSAPGALIPMPLLCPFSPAIPWDLC